MRRLRRQPHRDRTAVRAGLVDVARQARL